MQLFDKYKFQFYLLFLVLVCYWPFTLFLNSLSNDNIDVALATKYFAGTCLQNGELPLWNPYQLFGFPAHADLQYTNWSLEVLIIGILKGYDYYLLHVLYLVYLYIGVLGMFLLSRFLSKNNLTAFYIAIIYILSGLFTAHSQSLVTILGLVWMPYVLLYFLKWMEDPSLKASILVAIFSYLAFTLGYQAFAFMLIPILFGLLLLKIYQAFKNNTLQLIKSYLLWGIVTLLFLGILLAQVIVTQIQSKPFVERLNGMSLEDVMSHPFSPFGLISIINPILTIGNDDLFNSDVTMRNIYMGIIPVVLLLIALFKKNKTKIEYLLLFFGLLYILASFGDYTPIRKILFYTLPGFKLFRFPSLIRIVAVACLLLYLILNFNYSIRTFFQNKKTRNLLLLGFLVISIALTFISFTKCPSFTFFSINDSFNQKVMKSSPYEIAFYYGIFQISFLLACLFLFNQTRSFKTFFKRIIAFTIIELSFTIFIYGQYVAFSNTKPSELQENFSKLTSNFPEPSKDAEILNVVKYDYLSVLWKNTGCFKKQAMPYDEWTSYLFKNYNQLQDHFPNLKDSLYSYPFVYFSKPNKHEKPITKTIDTNLEAIQNTFHFRNREVQYSYLTYSPHQIQINYNSQENCILNLQQTYYEGWKVTIDGIETPFLWNASLLMSVPIPKGNHLVQFSYSNNAFTYSLIISLSVLMLLLIALVLLSSNSNFRKSLLIGLILLSATGLCCLFFAHASKNKSTNSTFTFPENKTRSLKLNNKEDIQALWELCNKYKSDTISYQWNNYYHTPELLYSLNINPENNKFNPSSGNLKFLLNDRSARASLFSEIYDTTYSGKQFIDTLDRALIMESKNNPYTKAQSIPLNQLQNKNIYGFVKLKSHKGSDPYVGCVIKTKDGKEKQKYFALNKYLIANGTYQSIPFYFEISTFTEEIEEIKLFLMNQTDAPVHVKTFEAEFYKSAM